MCHFLIPVSLLNNCGIRKIVFPVLIFKSTVNDVLYNLKHFWTFMVKGFLGLNNNHNKIVI